MVLPIALQGVLSTTVFTFLASFDELLISMFFAGVHAQTLPVRIWNSLMQIEPTIAAASAFVIEMTTLILSIETGVDARTFPALGTERWILAMAAHRRYHDINLEARYGSAAGSQPRRRHQI
jgi:ABC-type spermidine/putrescine transport system permease subunit I